MNNRIQRVPIGSLCLLVLAILLTGCLQDTTPEAETSLKILSLYDRVTMDNLGLRTFAQEHGDLTITFLDAGDEAASLADKYGGLQSRIESEKPDVIIADSLSFGMLARQDVLSDLHPFIERDDYPIEEMHPGVAEWVRQSGNGQLTGLAPYFQSQVMFYNSGLFRQFGVPVPTDRMTWEEVLQTAARFMPSDNPEETVYGYYDGMSGDPLALADRIAASANLDYMNWERREVMADSEGWLAAYRTAIEAQRSGSVYSRGAAAPPEDLFEAGRVAMMMGSYADLLAMTSEQPKFEWGMVTQPVDGRDRSVGNLAPEYLYAIYSDAEHPEEAWELVRELSSRETAVKHEAATAQLPSWLPDAPSELDVFYQLTANPRPVARFWEFPADWPVKLQQIRSGYYRQALEGQLSVEEALRHTQAELEQLMQAAQ
jgi:multiple sugar transport system substrate-binding protein